MFQFEEISSSSACLGKLVLFYSGTPCAFHITILLVRSVLIDIYIKRGHSVLIDIYIKGVSYLVVYNIYEPQFSVKVHYFKVFLINGTNNLYHRGSKL